MEYVYAIGDESGNVKIGITNDPDRRLRDLSIGNASRLTLLSACNTNNARAAESEIHEALTAIGRHSRGEWFEPGIATTIIVNALATEPMDRVLAVTGDLRAGLSSLPQQNAPYELRVRATPPPSDLSERAVNRRAYMREYMRKRRLAESSGNRVA